MKRHKHKNMKAGKSARRQESRAVPPVATAKTKVRNDQEVGTVLSAEQKKHLVKQKLREQKARKVPRTSQQTIAYQEMFQDGICRVDDRHYTTCL